MTTPTESPTTTRDRLVETAMTETGLDDFGEASWQEGLDIYLEALAATAQLNEIGVGVAESGVVSDLSNRLRIEEWRRTHPAVAAAEIVRPIIIVGQPRTATTILFQDSYPLVLLFRWWRRHPDRGARVAAFARKV